MSCKEIDTSLKLSSAEMAVAECFLVCLASIDLL